jgi:hypothetical protein
MTTRQYSSRSQQTTLTSAITAGTTSITVVSGTALLGGVTIPAGRTFTLVIDPDTALEEIVDATAVSTNTFTITRAIDGSSAQEHSAGAVVRHMAIGRDYRDANLHTQASASYNDGAGNAQSMHGIASGEGDVVGTDKAQTLTNKTLTSPTISNPTLTGTPLAEASIVFEGATADDHETTLTVVDPTQDNTITLPNTSGTVTINNATQTLTNKTLTSPTISGSPVITGLSSAGMSATSATPKDYVDSILGSATAASTSAASAATSATSAATSATSAAASATAAATSASSASASATAATTSATSASNSASAAATSATSASNSASTASTSATSAETSATSSATSASAAATSATSAATSATSSATSASAAATSATSAAASATAAATSATSAATSYDQFDDRYLGNKSSDPTLDNDGGALLTGALYFNDVIDAMKVYNGASWDLVAPDTTNFIDKTILTAKGSIISASTASTPVALTVAATDGYILSVSAAATSGLAWVAPNPADITGITASSPLTGGGTSGDVTVGIQDGTTAQKGAVQLEDSTSSTSTTNAATPNSVKSAYDLANAAVPKSTIDAKGDLIVGSADNVVVKLTAGTNEERLVTDSATTSGLKYVADTTNYAIAAKGDLLVGTAADTVAALTAGSNGDTLVADSSAATGLSYAENYAAGKNKIINGNFSINQRAFSSTTSNGVFTFDRWLTTAVGTQTYTTQTFTPGTAPVAGYEGSTFLQIATDGGASNYATIQQRIEDVRTFAGQTATVSFWAKANSGTPKVGIQVYQIFGSGGSARVDVTTVYITLSTSWTRYTGNFVIPSISGKTIGTSSYLDLEITVNNAFDGTVGQQTNTFQLWGVQMEEGSVATAFQTATGTLQGELAACQRYYWRFGAHSGGTAGAYQQYGITGYVSLTTQALVQMMYPVRMRATPTSIDFANISINDVNNTTFAITALTFNAQNDSTGGFVATIAGATANRFCTIQNNNNTGGFLGISAEL